MADSEASQPQNTYDIQNPEYDVIEGRGEFNMLFHERSYLLSISKIEHTMSYAVVDESRVSRQHRRPRPGGPPIPGSVRSRGRPEQPPERPTQQMEPRTEAISATAGTHQSLDARRANLDK